MLGTWETLKLLTKVGKGKPTKEGDPQAEGSPIDP